MSDNSFLNSSNIQKLNKEMNDLKSRKILTDLLNSQIDQNEHLTSENTTLIMNQRKLLNLLQSKDRVIEEIKSGTLSFCENGYNTENSTTADDQQNTSSTYRQLQIQSFQNKAQLMADHQWQILLSRIQQGGLLLSMILQKQKIQNKHKSFGRLKDNLFETQINYTFRQLNTKNQQNQILKLYALFKVILSLQYKRKKQAFNKINMIYDKSLQQEMFNEQRNELIKHFQQENNKNNPMVLYKEFYSIFKMNQQNKNQGLLKKKKGQLQMQKLKKVQNLHKLGYTKNDQKFNEDQNNSINHQGMLRKLIKKLKSFEKQQSCSKLYKAIIILQKGRIQELINSGGMSKEQVQDFIQKTQIIVNTIQNDFNNKCLEIEYLKDEKNKLKNLYEQELENQKQNQSDLENMYKQQFQQIEQIKQKNNYEKEELNQNYQQKINEHQNIQDEMAEQIQNLQSAYDEKCVENKQLQENIYNIQLQSDNIIQNLKEQLQQSQNQDQQQNSMISMQVKEFEENYIQKQKEVNYLQEEKQIQQRKYEEQIQKLQREIKELKQNEEGLQMQLQNSEQRQEALKKDFLQARQLTKDYQFEKEERILEIENLSKKVNSLQNEKNILINNLETSIVNLKDLKQQYDQMNSNLNKTKEENLLLFHELEEKTNHINELDLKIFQKEKMLKDAERRASASPNRHNERDDLNKKFNKLKKEKDELQANYDELQQKVNRIKATNTDLTKEAIELNQEKLQMNETIENLNSEVEQRLYYQSVLEDKIQKLLQKIEEKDIQLQKLQIKPELFQKLAQDKIELEDENQGLKKELLRIHQQIDQFDKIQQKHQQEQQEQKQKEQELKEEIHQINQNLATLTRERIGYLRENQQKLHEVTKMKEENQQLKNLVDQYQLQIDDYQQQLDLFSKIFKSMESKINNIKYNSQNTIQEAKTEIQDSNHDLSHSTLSQNHNHSQNNTNNNHSRSRSHSINSNLQENQDFSNLNGQQLIKKIDQMKMKYQNFKSN